jgi:Type II CAAX prenyl endopeptidase Rce1-like
MNKLCLTLAVFGITGVASLGLAPLETLIPPSAQLSVPRFALLIQPMLLVLGATVLGCWAAPKAGLTAPIVDGQLSGKPVGRLVRAALGPAVLGGVVVALILLSYGALTQSVFAGAKNADIARLMAFQPPLLSKLLYGGIAEELLARWGMMSAVALGALKLGFVRSRALWTGNIIAALLFGLGHLPLLFSALPSPPLWLVGAVIIGNVVPGLIFGLLFWRRGLESAMMAHATGHLLSTLALSL